MAELAGPLRDFLPKAVVFPSLPDDAEIFFKLKDSGIVARGVIQFENAKLIVVQADASQSGLGV